MLGGIGGVTALVGGVLHELHGPDIHPNAGVVDAPFSLTFTVSNPAKILPIVSTGFECHVIRLNAHRISPPGLQINMENETVSDIEHFRIAPGKKVQIPCRPFATIIIDGGVAIDRAQIETKLSYSTLGVRRGAISQRFNWDSTTKQWTEGEVVP